MGSEEGDARRKGCVNFLLCSGEWGTTPLSWDHHPRRPFILLQGCPMAGRQQAATTQASQFAGNRFGFFYPFGFAPI